MHEASIHDKLLPEFLPEQEPVHLQLPAFVVCQWVSNAARE